MSRACGSREPFAAAVIVLEGVPSCRLTTFEATVVLLPARPCLLTDAMLAAERRRGRCRMLRQDADKSVPGSTGSGACGPPWDALPSRTRMIPGPVSGGQVNCTADNSCDRLIYGGLCDSHRSSAERVAGEIYRLIDAAMLPVGHTP